MDLSAMNKISYGLFVLAARDGEKDNGCIINTVIQVTATPNRIAFAVNKSNYTHDIIQKTKLFTVSVLDESARFGTFRNFGFQSGRTAEKFAEIEFARSPNGIAYLTRECCAWISGRVSSTVDLGTHTLFIADVEDCALLSENPPVTYAFYHANIKPKQPAPAGEKKKGFICVICGYIYEGDVLPPDFICPVCKHPASDFKPL